MRLAAARLLAGRGGIHVDFHAAGHFDDLGGFPGHWALLLKVFPSTVSHKLLRKEKFGEIFFEPKIEVICCDAKVGFGREVADRASK